VFRIGIIDDHQLFTDGLSSALRIKDEVTSVEVLNSPETAEEWFSDKEFDVVMLDVMMPAMSGVELIPLIMKKGIKVLVVTSRSDREMLKRCMASGAHGFCSKNTSVAELLSAMQKLMQGETYVCSGLGVNAEPRTELQELTDREKEVIRLLAKGYSSRLIAEELFITEHTVNTHRKRMLRKYGCNTTTALIDKLVMAGVDLSA
jgi:DNA-binding NarL/FixJ family response regulator